MGKFWNSPKTIFCCSCPDLIVKLMLASNLRLRKYLQKISDDDEIKLKYVVFVLFHDNMLNNPSH